MIHILVQWLAGLAALIGCGVALTVLVACGEQIVATLMGLALVVGMPLGLIFVAWRIGSWIVQ